ncbi:hypothetical protein H311_00063, partial [Anncaliia algerae PRA109]
EKTNKPIEFIVKIRDTNQVIDDPGRAKQSKVIFFSKHGKQNQRVSFILTGSGALNLIIRGKKIVYNPVNDSFKMSGDFSNDEGEFILIDKGVSYKSIFKEYPIKESDISLEDPLRNSLLGITRPFGPVNYRLGYGPFNDFKNAPFGRNFLPSYNNNYLRDNVHRDFHNSFY